MWILWQGHSAATNTNRSFRKTAFGSTRRTFNEELWPALGFSCFKAPSLFRVQEQVECPLFGLREINVTISRSIERHLVQSPIYIVKHN